MKDDHDPNSGSWQSDVRVVNTVKPVGETLEAALSRFEQIGEEAKSFRQKLELFAAGQPQTKACEKHPGRVRKLDMDESSRQSRRRSDALGDDNFVLTYTPCPECEVERNVANESNWLSRAGVPEIILHGSFKTFRIENEEDRINVAIAKTYVAKKKGFLVMTGNKGDGKSMLAVAIMREFLAGKFITQNDLLFDLRRGYGNPKAEDVIEKCQSAKCLVLDDIGLSMGGKDELPMLQSILDHRYGEKLPTIFTSNLTLPQIYSLIGPRLEDRFKQALYRHLTFSGPSSRPGERQTYLTD